MKRLRKWKQIFTALGTGSAIFLFFNWLMNEGTQQATIRLYGFVIALVFFVAALILDIIKSVIGEARSK